MSNKRIFTQIIKVAVPVLVLAVAVAVAAWLIKTKPSPRKQKPQFMASTVNTLTAAKGRHDVTIVAMGTVSPVEEVALHPEVTGLVVWKHQNLVPGGIVHQGETLLRIDARNYEATQKQQAAALEKATVEYQLELSRSEVAKEEWRMLNQGKNMDFRGQRLALREPQLQAAIVAVQAASNLLARATLDVERTSITAPFNAVVIDEFIDRGQLVSPQSLLAQLAGTDAFRVEASLPVRDLQQINWPDDNGEGGPSAVVLYDIGNTTQLEFKGKVTRVLSSVDNAARMGRILVRIQDPLMLGKNSVDVRKGKLLSGAYVKVFVEGLPMDNVIKLPDSVIHEGNLIWVMNANSKLELRDITVVWRQNGQALVRGDIIDGEHVVSSHISSPIPGMKLQVKGQAPAKEGTAGKKGKKQK